MLKVSRGNRLFYDKVGGTGTGLTPEQVSKLAKSAKYQGPFTSTQVFITGESAASQGAIWEKLTDSPASSITPYSDPVNWRWLSGEVEVTTIPPQGTVGVTAPAFIFDTVNRKRYRLETTSTDPIYVPADGSTSTGGSGSNQIGGAGINLVGNAFNLNIGSLPSLT